MLILHHGRNFDPEEAQPAGTVVATAPMPTASAAGVVTRTGTVAASAPKPVMAAAGVVTRTGTVAATAPKPTVAATDTVVVDLTTGLLEYVDLAASPWTSQGGSVVPTESGTGTIGTRTAPDGVATSLDLDTANGQYLTYASALAFTTTTGGVAFSWWVHYDGGTNYPSSVRVGSQSYTPPFAHYYDVGASSQRIRMYIGGIQRDTNITLSAGWNHIIVQHNPDANQIEIYINDGAATTHATSGTFATGTQPLAIGFLNGSTTWDGGVAMAGFYENRYFDADHRTALYNGGSGRLHSEL